jgi:hypothetical protein
MKKAIKILLISLTAITLLSACASPPTNELTVAKAAIDEAVGEGAEQFVPAEFERIKLKFADAMNEINAQDKLTLKNYSLAVFTLTQVKEGCDALKPKIAQRKEELRVAAEKALAEAPAVAIAPTEQK